MFSLRLLLVWAAVVQASLGLTEWDKQLTYYLTNVSASYFAPGRTVLLSMSLQDDSDMKTELVKELHHLARWPVIVHRSGYDWDIDKTTVVHPHGSFVFFTKYLCTVDGGDWVELPDFELLVKNNNNLFYPIFGTEAVFVFVITIRCDSWIDFEVLKGMFDALFIVRITRAVVIWNRPQSTSLQVYAHFPYQSPEQCGQVTSPSHLTLLDTWVMEGDGHFVQNTDLFPHRTYKDLHGCAIRAAREADLQRYVKDLLEIISTAMNTTVQHVDDESSTGGRDTDIVLYGIGVSLQHTTRYHWFTVRWYVPCGVQSSRLGRLFKILSLSLWLVSPVTMLAVAIAMARLANKAPGTSEHQTYQTVGSSLTEVLAAILGVSVSVMPRTPAARVLFMFWVCFSLAYNTVFLSYLTTYMIDPGYEPDLEDMDQLLASDLTLCVKEEDLKNSLLSMDSEFSEVLQNRAIVCPAGYAVKWASRYRNCSTPAIEDDVKLMYLTGQLTADNKLCPLDDGVVLTFGASFCFLPPDPLFHPVNDVITRLVEAGVPGLFREMDFNELLLRHRPPVKPSDLAGYHAYNMVHLLPAFVWLLYALLLGVPVLLLELLWHRWHRQITTLPIKLKFLLCKLAQLLVTSGLVLCSCVQQVMCAVAHKISAARGCSKDISCRHCRRQCFAIEY